jgi:hypothetical protein
MGRPDGHRSRQIDVAIFDRLYSPLLFPSDSGGLHIPAESVYAVFEVKQDLNQRLIRDAGRKAASVRHLRRTSVGIALQQGAFEIPPRGQIRLPKPDDALVFFMFRLLERLRALGTAPAADLMDYARSLF